MHIVVAVTYFLTNNIVQSFVQNRQKSSRGTQKKVYMFWLLVIFTPPYVSLPEKGTYQCDSFSLQCADGKTD